MVCVYTLRLKALRMTESHVLLRQNAMLQKIRYAAEVTVMLFRFGPVNWKKRPWSLIKRQPEVVCCIADTRESGPF